jgi:hypothetical protein
MIVNELSSNPTIENDIEVFIGKGTYAGFRIPDGSLFPLFNTAYRLVIRGEPGEMPTLDFNYSEESATVGADIGSGNPNVRIEGIRIQYFPVGIRASINSHYPIVKNCIVTNNRNVGIFFDQVAQAQAIQNVVVNGDYGIVFRLTKSAIAIHNTIFMNGAISTSKGKSISCIWAELANDYGNGLTDSGSLHLLGNIGWNTSGRCLTLFTPDVERTGAIISNYNDWVVGDKEEFIVVEDNAFFSGNVTRTVFKSLQEWKQLGFDSNSKSEDPKFISAVKVRSRRNGYALDLNLLPISPVLGMVPSYGYTASSELPSYFDSTELKKDILNKNRSQAGTAAGANDKPSTSGFFGQDVFSDPLDVGTTKECGIDPFVNIIHKSIDLWYPSINKGYFYSNEREFYLYSKKETRDIGYLAHTEFVLPAKMSTKTSLDVQVAGVNVDSSSYDLIGNRFILFHKDLPILVGDEEVTIRGDIATWNNASFVYSNVLYRFKINEGSTRFFLPESYAGEGPVVVTDDMSYPTDSDYISNREFCISFDHSKELSELVFANRTNQVLNSQFDYYDSNAVPAHWQSSGAAIVAGSVSLPPVAGGMVCSVEDGGYIRTFLPIDTGSHCFSFHVRSPGSGTLDYKIKYFDIGYDDLGSPETGSVDLTNSWNRYNISFSSPLSDFDTLVPAVPYPCTQLVSLTQPTRSAYVSIELSHTYNPAYTGSMYLDAVQYEKEVVPSLYHRKILYNELTVEFESSSDPAFIDTNQCLSPISTLVTDGFLYIPEVPASTYFGPSYPAITTLHEWRWPEGRKLIIPWSRTKGKDKLRKRPKGRFNLIPEVKPEIISPVCFTPKILDAYTQPSVPSSFVGDNVGVGFVIRIYDEDSNPCVLTPTTVQIYDINNKYPGALFIRKAGLKHALGTAISLQTDSSGSIVLTWIPPTEDAGLYRGPIPSPKTNSPSGQNNISAIETEHALSFENAANIVILDYNGNPLPTKATAPVGAFYTPIYEADASICQLVLPPVRGSINVIVDGVQFTESDINTIDSNQFFVDYEQSIVRIKGRVTNIYIEYIQSYILLNKNYPNLIMFYHDQIFDGYSGSITVGYDINIKLLVTCTDPSDGSSFVRLFDLVAQNQLSNRPEVFNPIAREI